MYYLNILNVSNLNLFFQTKIAAVEIQVAHCLHSIMVVILFTKLVWSVLEPIYVAEDYQESTQEQLHICHGLKVKWNFNQTLTQMLNNGFFFALENKYFSMKNLYKLRHKRLDITMQSLIQQIFTQIIDFYFDFYLSKRFSDFS